MEIIMRKIILTTILAISASFPSIASQSDPDGFPTNITRKAFVEAAARTTKEGLRTEQLKTVNNLYDLYTSHVASVAKGKYSKKTARSYLFSKTDEFVLTDKDLLLGRQAKALKSLFKK